MFWKIIGPVWASHCQWRGTDAVNLCCDIASLISLIMTDSTGFSAQKMKVGQTKEIDVQKNIYLITIENVPCRNIYVSSKN